MSYIDPYYAERLSCATVMDEGGWGVAIVEMPEDENGVANVLLSQYIPKNIGAPEVDTTEDETDGLDDVP